MRITRDLLLNLARENAAKFAAKDRGLVCVYLTGSLLRTDEPFIGGVTDIDLICVHDRPVNAPREIVRINADVHLDIAHYAQEDFTPARK
jgi:predicted nucleotidyltransferase